MLYSEQDSVDTVRGGAQWFSTTVLALCIFTSGACVMLYEFLAIRILARYFGSAMEVWAAEISVCLAGLAVGYGVGGYLADRFQTSLLIGAAMLLGGAGGFFIEPLASGSANVLIHLDFAWHWHPLLTAGISSFFPFVALGAVLPQAVRLSASNLNHVGIASGLTIALSTVGSITGVLSISPMLLVWTVRQVISATSVALLTLGVAVMLLSVRPRRTVSVGVLAVLSLADGGEAEIIFDEYSAHHHILVEDVDGKRLLRFNDAVQSTMSLAEPDTGGFGYTNFFHVPMVFDPTITRVLFLGLGGGTGPKAFLRDYPDVKVEVAELDPAVLQIARRYFSVPEDPRLGITIQDARVYLNRSKQTFGAIIMDAYASGPRGAYLPYHLATREFFQLVRSHLTVGGALVFNAVGSYRGLNSSTVESVLATLRITFEAVYVFEAKDSINTLIVAVNMDSPVDNGNVTAEWPKGPWQRHPVSALRLKSLAETLVRDALLRSKDLPAQFSPFSPVHNAPVNVHILTDNYAPVDIGGR